jgi:hypothetical protein
LEVFHSNGLLLDVPAQGSARRRSLPSALNLI